MLDFFKLRGDQAPKIEDKEPKTVEELEFEEKKFRFQIKKDLIYIGIFLAVAFMSMLMLKLM